MKEGSFHADNGDAQAVLVRADATEVDGENADLINVLAAGDEGSGLDAGWNLRHAKQGDKTGEWTPAA